MDFGAIIPIILAYRYWILFPLACFEGPILSFVVGVLAALGYFDPIVAYLVLVFGDIIPDAAYYYIGRYGEKNAFVVRQLARPNIASHLSAMRMLWNRHTGTTVFFGKLAYGLAPAFLISAGLAHVPARTYFTYTIPIALFQYAVLLGLGYYSGVSFAFVNSIVNHIGFVIVGVVLLGLGYYFFTRSMRDRFLELEKTDAASL